MIWWLQTKHENMNSKLEEGVNWQSNNEESGCQLITRHTLSNEKRQLTLCIVHQLTNKLKLEEDVNWQSNNEDSGCQLISRHTLSIEKRQLKLLIVRQLTNEHRCEYLSIDNTQTMCFLFNWRYCAEIVSPISFVGSSIDNLQMESYVANWLSSLGKRVYSFSNREQVLSIDEAYLMPLA